MNYVISDFKNLVSAWFNEFLPNVDGGKKATFVENANIVYINKVNLESLRGKTIQFMQERVSQMLESKDAVYIFVQEPKPVNNVRLVPVLKVVEKSSVDSANREKILHLANRRYVLESSDVYVSQNKEMDEFLSGVFLEFSRMTFIKARFYGLQYLGISDMVSCAYGFFPRSSLSVQENYMCKTINVHSTNDILGVLSDRLLKGKPLDSRTSLFVERCRRDILKDIEGLV